MLDKGGEARGARRGGRADSGRRGREEPGAPEKGQVAWAPTGRL